MDLLNISNLIIVSVGGILIWILFDYLNKLIAKNVKYNCDYCPVKCQAHYCNIKRDNLDMDKIIDEVKGNR